MPVSLGDGEPAAEVIVAPPVIVDIGEPVAMGEERNVELSTDENGSVVKDVCAAEETGVVA